jgi:D-arabinose 1-dehydrogenase-like Zn-dependent alcohol dehydrogenase
VRQRPAPVPPAEGRRAIGGLPAPTEPVIAGHEPCGIVAAIGPGVSEAQAKIGQRVMVHHYKGCTVCNHCRSGWSQLCQEQCRCWSTATTPMAGTPNT